MASLYWLAKECLMIKQNRSFIDKVELRKAKQEIERSINRKQPNSLLEQEESKSHCTKIMEVFGDWNILLWPFPIYRLREENTILEKEFVQSYIK